MQKELMDLNQLREYLPDKPAAITVYTWVSNNAIPYKKYGKKLFFVKSQIDAWNENGRNKTAAE